MAAARLLAAVVDARTPLDGMTDQDHGHPLYRVLEPRDRALVRAILVTALRYRRTVEALISARLRSPLPANATTLSHILHAGAAQILFLDVPDSAAVDLAVTHAKADPRTARFAALVNAVLRGISRDKAADLARALAATTDAPDWFSNRLRSAYGAERTARYWPRTGSKSPTDFTVKADPRTLGGRAGRRRLADRIGAVRAPCRPGAGTARLCRGRVVGAGRGGRAAGAPVRRCKGTAGRRPLRGPRRQDRAACGRRRAGDGGGLLGQPSGAAANQSGAAAARRLHHPGRYTRMAAGGAFRCHSAGRAVFVHRYGSPPSRRAWTKTPADIEKLAGLQRRLLDSAVRLVRPGGRIVFSNCSLDPLEGEEMIRTFLAENKAVAADPIHAGELPGTADFVTPEGFLRTTPADLVLPDPALSGMDGFFAARLRRLA